MKKNKRLLTYLCATGVLAGATLIGATTVIPKEKIEVSAASETNSEIQKEDIQNKMANSIDNFSYAKGSYRYFAEFSNTDYTVDFQVRLKGQPASYSKSHNLKTGTEFENKFDGNNVMGILHADKTYYINSVDKENPEDPAVKGKLAKQRYIKDSKGNINGAVYRHDPAFMGMASEILFNQNIIFGFLQDYSKWDIVGHEDYLGYDSTVLAGQLSEGYKIKQGATTFKMWVDSKTGILLKSEAYNENNEVVFSITCTDLKLNGTLDDNKFKLEKPVNYKELESKPLPKQ